MDIETFQNGFYFSFLSPNRYDRELRKGDPMSHVRGSRHGAILDEPADSVCHVHWIFAPQKTRKFETKMLRHLLIVSEIANNPGMSVTNSWEYLLPQLRYFLQIEPGSFEVIEHYGAFSYNDENQEGPEPRRFHNVTFNYDGTGETPSRPARYSSVEWKPTNPQRLHGILGKHADEIDWPFE